MKHLIILIAAVAVIIAMKISKKNKLKIIIAFLIVVALTGAYNTLTRLGGLVSMIRPFNQLFYQTQYLDDGIYADSILPHIVDGKKVYTKDDINHLVFDMNGSPAWEVHLDEIHYGINSENSLKAFGAETIRDASLNDVIISDEMRKDFEVLGYANDMLRYSAAVGFEPESYWNYFHHCYIYNDRGVPLQIYLHVTDMDSDLVALWQKVPEGYGEDLYIMDKDYFEENVKH